MAPSAQPPIATADEKLDALSNRRQIKTNLDAALATIKTGSITAIEERLLKIQHHFTRIENYLSASIEPMYYAQHRPSDSTLAAKVFSVPELLENILRNLEVVDIMRCLEVNRTFRDTIEASSKLQTCLFLQPAPKGTMAHCPFRFKNFKCFCNLSFTLDPDNEVEVDITATADNNYALPNIGCRWKHMLISQPPIYEMTYTIHCDPDNLFNVMRHPGSRRDQPKHTITSNKGLTVDDLCKAAKALFKRHADNQCDMNCAKKAVRFEGLIGFQREETVCLD